MKMSDEAIRDETGSRAARSYFIDYQGRRFDMKAIFHFAYDISEKPWDRPQSSAAAAYLRRHFDVVHLART